MRWRHCTELKNRVSKKWDIFWVDGQAKSVRNKDVTIFLTFRTPILIMICNLQPTTTKRGGANPSWIFHVWSPSFFKLQFTTLLNYSCQMPLIWYNHREVHPCLQAQKRLLINFWNWSFTAHSSQGGSTELCHFQFCVSSLTFESARVCITPLCTRHR